MQDVLENEDITLDKMFISSIVKDILQVLAVWSESSLYVYIFFQVFQVIHDSLIMYIFLPGSRCTICVR